MAVCLVLTGAPVYLGTRWGFIHIKMEDPTAVMWAQQTGVDTSVIEKEVSVTITLSEVPAKPAVNILIIHRICIQPRQSVKNLSMGGHLEAPWTSEWLLQPGLARCDLVWLCIPPAVTSPCR